MSTPTPVFVKAETYTKRFVKCPICKDDCQGFYVDHLLEYTKHKNPYDVGPWQCKKCNNHFNFLVYADGTVEISQDPKEIAYVNCLVLLKSTHEGNPIYLMLNEKSSTETIAEEKMSPGSSHLPYFYGEHTCPTNFIRDIIAITFEQDTDPHGVFEFVRLLSIPDALAIMKANNVELDNYDSIDEKDIEDTFDDHMALLFPECIESGNEYEGTVIESPLLITN